MIGEHLIIDGVFKPPLGEKEIEDILLGLPPRIGMHILAGPFVVRGEPENPGWTGFVIIDKSHIAIHTFHETNSVALDVFSCKPFDSELVLEYLNEHIHYEKMNVKLLHRTEGN
jgi:S-adenosylmethionine decarboxylase